MPSGRDLVRELIKLKNAKKAKWNAPYVGNKPGGYGEKDVLLGITVPDIRKTTKDYHHLQFSELSTVISSKYHEVRFAAVVILVTQYNLASNKKTQKQIYDFYVEHVISGHINNWDLIDASAYKICGPFLYKQYGDCGSSIFMQFAESENVWTRRLAVVSTFYHIRQNNFDITMTLAKYLLNDSHDLIHKAVGWMLREVGKRDIDILTGFLDEHHRVMPRVMLRYAIEKLSKTQKSFYLTK